MTLLVPQSLTPAEAADVVAALREHMDVGDARWLVRKSVDPARDAPFLQLIGDVATWLPLSAAATVFFSTLAKRAADATWDALARAFQQKDAKPLADVATALGKAMEKSGPATELIVGLSIPDRHWGTALVIRDADPVKIAAEFAVFIAHAEKIARTMEAEVAAGRAPLGRARISIEGDTVVVRWMSQGDLAKHEVRIV
jgi:hypothetical protein